MKIVLKRLSSMYIGVIYMHLQDVKNGSRGGFDKKVRQYSGCVNDASDHIPQNLLRVFETPKKYLKGPLSDAKSPAQHFIIVGCGISGLLSAYLLLQVGHKVTMLESSDRVGGRIFTHYGQNFYADLGAMRFPPSHHILHGVVKQLGIPLTRFTHLHETPSSYFFLNDKYYSAAELGAGENTTINEAKLVEVYNNFGIKEEQIPRDQFTGNLINPFKLCYDILEKELSLTDLCKNDRSLAVFMRKAIEERQLPVGLMHLWGVIDLQRPFFGHSVLEFVTDSNQEELMKAEHDHTFYMEIVNGSSVLPSTILQKILQYQDRFTLKFDSRVTKVDEKPDGKVDVVYESGQIEGDHVIMTPTTRAQKFIDFHPPLPYMKKLGIDSLEYFGSVKIFLIFRRPFWSETNKAPIIHYSGSGLKGATAVTDNLLKTTYYPSNDLHGPAILASYTWEHDADVWISMSDKECQDKAIELLEKVHGDIVRRTFVSSVIKKWDVDNHARGAFVVHDVFQKQDFMMHLMVPHGKVSVSGEYANKDHQGWVEAALESSLRSLVNIWPQQFDNQFGQDEAEAYGTMYEKIILRNTGKNI